MNLADLSKLLGAEVLCGENHLDRNICYVCAGDLMSDILVVSHPDALLVTGLVNLQVIRTAEMLDIAAVVFIRGKRPTEDMLSLSREKNIPLLVTSNTLYTSCGILFETGLKNPPM